jgi:FkbM family methyltransferase
MVQKLERRSVLGGALAGVALGGASGLGAGLLARSAPAESGDLCGDVRGKVSYAQIGEDLVIKHVLDRQKVVGPSYLDIGAFHPIHNNNTYLLYRSGGRGVLVEPNPALAAELKKTRPNDVIVEAGIGVSGTREADYYVVKGDGQLNTFSKEQADALSRKYGPKIVERVVKRPLVTVNELLQKHFESSPDVVSIDVEGMDLEILRSFDFDRARPRLFCVETSEVETGATNPAIVALMRERGYSVRGGNLVNTIFVDDKRA